MSPRVMIVYGTRPEAIKIAPMVHALQRSELLEPYLVSTGQHREMVDQVNTFFGITPDVDLDLMTHGATVNEIYRRVLEGVERVIAEAAPDAILVQGDTASASAAALAAFFAQVPVVHLEAGLRTGNMRSPFPEEANRRLAAVVTDLHLAPTSGSRANLEREGIDPATIVVTGNTVIDALHWTVRQDVQFTSGLLDELGKERRLVLITTHRREAWGEPMKAAMRGIAQSARLHPDVDFVLPMHRNPIVREVVDESLGDVTNVALIEPLDYAEFAHLMKKATIVVTDSGGVQEEAPSLAVPVLVLRDTTERPEGAEAGTVKLIGTDQAVVHAEIERLLTDPVAHASMATAINPYGDGFAAERSVRAIESMLCGTERPEEFAPGLTAGAR